jgi:hypothetical protein
VLDAYIHVLEYFEEQVAVDVAKRHALARELILLLRFKRNYRSARKHPDSSPKLSSTSSTS